MRRTTLLTIFPRVGVGQAPQAPATVQMIPATKAGTPRGPTAPRPVSRRVEPSSTLAVDTDMAIEVVHCGNGRAAIVAVRDDVDVGPGERRIPVVGEHDPLAADLVGRAEPVLRRTDEA